MNTETSFLTMQPDAGRGCGDRDEGDVYACCGLSKRGYPFEHFLVDPAKPMKWERGVKLLPARYGFDVKVNIGRDPKSGKTDGYMSAWSFAAEVGKFGLSRKFPKNFPFAKLNKQTRLRIVHPHAIPMFSYTLNMSKPHSFCKRWNEYKLNQEAWRETGFGYHPILDNGMITGREKCTCALRNLACVDHFDEEIVKANCAEWDEADEGRWFKVKMPSFEFSGTWPKSINFKHLKWSSGYFMWLPLTHFEIPFNDKHGMTDVLNQAGWEAYVTEW